MKICHKLKEEKINSKVVSFPCQEIFHKQSKTYKDKILQETKAIFSIEAGSTDSWERFVKDRGICFGIDDFGKSFNAMTLDTVKGFLKDSKKSRFSL